MKRVLYPASIAVLTTAAALPAVAAAKPTTPAHARAYEHAYRRVAHQLGARVPGRNIVRDGLPGGHRPSDGQTVSSLGVLERMLAPAAASVSSTGDGAGAAGVPACASESGTDYSTGPDNTNPSSGATGRYQILPSTAAAYGCNLPTN